MGLSWLWGCWRGRGALSSVRVVMYTRRGCHLCEDAWRALERARARHGFALEAVDVDGHPELASRYGLEVPVVTVDGKVRFRGVVNPHLLEKLVRLLAKR
jgi:glutaredoxin